MVPRSTTPKALPGPRVRWASTRATCACADGLTLAEAATAIEALNRDPAVDGIVVIYPVPSHLDAEAVGLLVAPTKDVDGASPLSAERQSRGEPAFVPATALAVLEILDHYQVPIGGRVVTVVGRSRVVGQPTAAVLAARGAHVTVAHSETEDIEAETRQAEILVVGAGVPRLIGPAHVNARAVVVDCGINVTDDGVVGDVDFAQVQPLVAAITPVPGGVGPVTTMMLLDQVVTAAERAAVHLAFATD